MASKTIDIKMRINTEFVGNANKLVKEVQSKFETVDLGKRITRSLSEETTKAFKGIYSDLGKLQSGLSKPGLNPKQYTDLFHTITTGLEKSITVIKKAGEEYQKAFNSPKNKEALNDLKERKALLEEIKKIQTSIKQSEASNRQTAGKLKDVGLDVDNKYTLDTLKRLADKRAANKKAPLSSTEEGVLGNIAKDEGKIKQVITWVNQYVQGLDRVKEKTAAIKELGLEFNIKGSPETIVNDLVNSIDKLQSEVITVDEFTASLQRLGYTKEQIEQLVNVLNKDFSGAMNEGTENLEKAKKAQQSLNDVLREFGIVISAASIARAFKNLIKDAFEFYKSLDSALNEIYVVSNLSSKAVNDLQGHFITMARNTGMALDDITKSAVLFYQQGLSTSEVMEMTRVTSEFAKVAGIDATDAANKLTAAVNGYCLAAEDASLVADKFNKVAAASAADINELSTAFSKAAAQANQAGVSMDNYLAYIATMEEATREAPENIGTGLKTIFSRMQQIKKGENTDDNVDVNQVETALKSVNIQLRDTEGQLKDLEQVFDELGPKWNTLDRNTQAYLGTIIAGTRQQSRFITLMQNWERVQDLADESANSAGQQAVMHAKAMESIESKLQQLHVAWQEFISNLASSDLFKGVISALTKLLNLVNKGNKPLLLLAGAVTMVIAKLKEMIALNPDSKLGKFFKNAQTKLKDGVNLWKPGSSKERLEGALDKANQTKIAEEQKKITEEITRLENEKLQDKTQEEQLEKRITELKREQADLNKKDLLTEEEKAAIKSQQMRQDIGNKTSQIGGAVMAAGMMVGDTNTSGLLTGGGMAAMGIGRAIANPADITAYIQAITGVVQLASTIANWADNAKKKMEELADGVRQAASEVSNVSTQIRSSERLLKQYDKLSNKVIKTTAEQKQLNDTIQQLGDIHEVEILEDDYGNLAINIAEVNSKLQDLRDQRAKLSVELTKAEEEALTSGYDIFGTVDVQDVMKEIFTTSSTEYRQMIDDIDDGLTKEARSMSESANRMFMSSLKQEMVNNIRRNPELYFNEGFANTLISQQADFSKLSSSEWNQLYQQIEKLKAQGDTLTFADAQKSLNNFYDTWSGKNKLADDEWKMLVNTVNGTVFENQSLIDFYNKIDELESKVNGEYYEKRLKAINNALKETANEANEISKNQMLINLLEFMPGGGGGLFSIAGTIINLVKAFDNGKKALGQMKLEKEVLEDQAKLYKDIAKEKGWINSKGGYDEEGAKKWAQSMIDFGNKVKETNAETQKFLLNLDSFSNFDFDNADEEIRYMEQMTKVMEGVKLQTTDGDKVNYLLKYYREHEAEMTEAMREQYQKMIDEAIANLSTSSFKSLTQIGEELDSISTDLRTMNDILADFNKTGSMSLDTFMDLAKVIDGIDITKLAQYGNGNESIYKYIDAIRNLDLAFDENNGMITANGNALKSLQQIQELQTKAKIAATIDDLEASRAATEAEIAMVEAQMDGTQAAINAVNALSDSEVINDDIINEANQKVSESSQQKLEAIKSTYIDDLNNNSKWATAIISNIGAATQAWNAYYKALRDGSGDVNELYNKAMKTSKDIKWAGGTEYSPIDWNKYKGTTAGESRQAILNDLNSFMERLQNNWVSLQATLATTKTNIKFLKDLLGKDLSKLGLDGDKTGKTLQKYIGQLKEIYNILNRIALLEHRLSTLDTYADIAQGEAYGDLMQKRLDYNQELLEQYKFLVHEQKQFTNGYRDFIKSVDGLEGVFDFDEYGQIIINWEKYSQLQDTVAEGQVSMKEKADDVYNTYTEMFKELQGYFDNYIKYLQNTLKLLQEAKSAYTSLEKQLASAIEEIYKRILDAKLDAIDKEKEALNDLKKAREEANKEQKNSKELSNLQTNMQRTLMDTSGASDSAFIKAQMDMNNKLDEIAEDKYSTMLQDLQDTLDDEKEMLQQEFDDMFEHLDWLYDFLEKSIMNDSDSIKNILEETDSWNKMSPTERWDSIREWDKLFETYSSIGIYSEKGIAGLREAIASTESMIKVIDEALKTTDTKGDAHIVQTIEKWAQHVSSSVSSAVSAAARAGSGGGGGYNTSPTSSYKPDGSAPTGPSAEIDTGKGSNSSSGPASKYNVGDKVRSAAGTFVRPWNKGKDNNFTQAGILSTYAMTGKFTIKEKAYDKNRGAWFYLLNTLPNAWFSGYQIQYKQGGLADFTGPAWLDGTTAQPEAVLNALQTKHFIQFTEALDKMYSSYNNPTQPIGGSTVSIGSIDFHVDSMSSVEDGKKAFDAFVTEFKKIGNQTGIKIDSFKNTL